jgi:hypothetical protein
MSLPPCCALEMIRKPDIGPPESDLGTSSLALRMDTLVFLDFSFIGKADGKKVPKPLS